MTSGPIDRSGPALHVLDIGQLVAGPFAATMLGDLGAEVIKVEPRRGDPTRWLGHGEHPYSYRWQVEGRNKRSVTLDLKHLSSREIFLRLIDWADVLIENMRPGVMERLGLGYDVLSAANPRLIYVHVSGWGRTGPYSSRPSYEFAASAFAGLTQSTGFPDLPPVLPGIAVADYMTAMFATVGALEAVRRRDGIGGTGRGNLVDVALYESIMRIGDERFLRAARDGEYLDREGSIPSPGDGERIVWGYSYQSSDGRYFAVHPATDAQFQRMGEVVGQPPEWAARPEFADSNARAENYHEIDTVIRDWIGSHTSDEVTEGLLKADVAWGPVNTPVDIVSNEHVLARESIVPVTNADGDVVMMQSAVPRFSAGGGGVRFAGERLGASNHDVYVDLLGYSKEQLDEFQEQGVI